MAKDPAVLFYTSDFLSGTFTMTDEQVGKYIRLLCLQHQKGLLTEKDMVSICKEYDSDVYSKFVKEGETYYNQRMKDEADRRKRFSDSRANNRKKKTSEKDMNNICNSYEKHMETENETVTINVNNTVFSIEKCKEIALKDDRWVKVNKTNDEELIRFNEYLQKQGIYELNPAEYKRYFHHLKAKKPDKVQKELTMDDWRRLAQEQDELEKQLKKSA